MTSGRGAWWSRLSESDRPSHYEEREIPHAYPVFRATSRATHFDHPGSAHPWSADQVHRAPAF